jgi:hypothetical protein
VKLCSILPWDHLCSQEAPFKPPFAAKAAHRHLSFAITQQHSWLFVFGFFFFFLQKFFITNYFLCSIVNYLIDFSHFCTQLWWFQSNQKILFQVHAGNNNSILNSFYMFAYFSCKSYDDDDNMKFICKKIIIIIIIKHEPLKLISLWTLSFVHWNNLFLAKLYPTRPMLIGQNAVLTPSRFVNKHRSLELMVLD